MVLLLFYSVFTQFLQMLHLQRDRVSSLFFQWIFLKSTYKSYTQSFFFFFSLSLSNVGTINDEFVFETQGSRDQLTGQVVFHIISSFMSSVLAPLFPPNLPPQHKERKKYVCSFLKKKKEKKSISLRLIQSGKTKPAQIISYLSFFKIIFYGPPREQKKKRVWFPLLRNPSDNEVRKEDVCQ